MTMRIKQTLWARFAVLFCNSQLKQDLATNLTTVPGAPVKTAEGERMVDLQKVFSIRMMHPSLGGSLMDRRQTGGLLTAVIGKWEAFKFSLCPALHISDVTVKNIHKWKLCASIGTNQLLLLCNLTAHPIDFKYRGNPYKNNDCRTAELERWEWTLLLLFSPNRFLITANIRCFSSTVNGLFFPLPHQPSLYKTKTN